MSKTDPVYQLHVESGVYVFEFLKDNLDPVLVEDLKVELPRVLEEGKVDKIVFDLAKVFYVPSRMLGVLMEVHQLMVTRNGKMCVCGLQPMILSVFKFMRLDTVLQVKGTREEAIKSLTTP